MTNEAELIIDKLNAMNGFIDEAESALEKGNIINLSHLDDEVAQLCAQTLSLPPEQAKSVQPIMANMIGKLEALALSLQSFQAQLKEKTK